jgi:hypothetical protein
MTKATLPSLLILLGACAVKDSHIAHEAETRLMGMSEVDLESCLGVPDQHSSFGDMCPFANELEDAFCSFPQWRQVAQARCLKTSLTSGSSLGMSESTRRPSSHDPTSAGWAWAPSDFSRRVTVANTAGTVTGASMNLR